MDLESGFYYPTSANNYCRYASDNYSNVGSYRLEVKYL